MPNPFDNLKESLHRLTTKTMGYEASWGAYSALVHFKNADTAFDKNGIDFIHTHPEAEWYEGDFPGLATLVEGGDTAQVLTVNGLNYHIRDILRKFDGATVVGMLQAVNEE